VNTPKIIPTTVPKTNVPRAVEPVPEKVYQTGGHQPVVPDKETPELLPSPQAVTIMRLAYTFKSGSSRTSVVYDTISTIALTTNNLQFTYIDDNNQSQSVQKNMAEISALKLLIQ